jgi:hypothetical protein
VQCRRPWTLSREFVGLADKFQPEKLQLLAPLRFSANRSRHAHGSEQESGSKCQTSARITGIQLFIYIAALPPALFVKHAQPRVAMLHCIPGAVCLNIRSRGVAKHLPERHSVEIAADALVTYSFSG